MRRYAPAGPSGTGAPYLRETRARQQRALTASHPYAVAPPNDKPYGFSMAMGGSYEATRSAYEPPKVYSFVPIPGINTKKRPRRRYDEIDRVYGCNHPGCDKSYGTLNHLNAHIVMHKHGPKRHPSEFKDVRRNLRRAKAPAGNPLVDSAVGSPSSPHEASEGEGASPSAKPPGKPPSPTNSV
ncbi:hypothetical protein IWQ60_009774 [Tieghemiomyces parasiticus]|uniref:C2H2-type domain-containing protein n=1 Tax=Tieghemiomyces parasiticus TaxID=78921 RepID=A0A9W8DPL2_9FUNG|nr:hypothetical protein IWQ60_009774 [Tieghemiomyces parasiticus]